MKSIGSLVIFSAVQLGLVTSLSGLSSGSDTCSNKRNSLGYDNRHHCLQRCSMMNNTAIDNINLTKESRLNINRMNFERNEFTKVANSTKNSSASVRVEWVETRLTCKEYVEQFEFKILPDGRIIAQISKLDHEAPLWMEISETSHCFRCDRNRNSCYSIVVCKEFLNKEIEQIKVLLANFRNDLLSSGGQSSGWLAMVSSLVLGLTISTYVLLWKDQNVHGWTQVSFLVALFCMYFSAGLRRLIGLNRLITLPTLAIALEGLEDLGGVAASTNLVALSFDLFITLWRPLPTHSKSFGLKRFIIATVIAWSAGFIFLGLNLSYRTEFSYARNDIVDISKHIEYTTKILESFLCIQMFGMVPSWWPTILQLSLLFINLILFIGSLVILYQKQKSLSVAMENVKRKKLIRTWIRRFVKMFLLMGLWWPMSVICILQCYPVFSHVISIWKETLATYYLKPKRVDFQIQWHVHLTANYLVVQAIIICILLIWNRRILQALWKKYPNLHSLTSE